MRVCRYLATRRSLWLAVGLATACHSRQMPSTIVIDGDRPYAEPVFRVEIVDPATGRVLWPPSGAGCEQIVRCCEAVSDAKAEFAPPRECLDAAQLLAKREIGSCAEFYSAILSALMVYAPLPSVCDIESMGAAIRE